MDERGRGGTVKGTCECCGFEDVEVRTYGTIDPDDADAMAHRPMASQIKRDHCSICASTFIGNAVTYHYEHASLYQALGYCTNAVLKALEAKPRPVRRVTKTPST